MSLEQYGKTCIIRTLIFININISGFLEPLIGPLVAAIFDSYNHCFETNIGQNYFRVQALFTLLLIVLWRDKLKCSTEV